MERYVINYETLLNITNLITMSKEPEDIPALAVQGVKNALKTKGCAFFLHNHRTKELELVASIGLSNYYIEKGPISSIKSIADSLKEGPVAIYDVTDDPRIQYPDEAKQEGICSILSVPAISHGKPIGIIRVYSNKPWKISLEDINFVQSVAQISSIAIEMGRLKKGLKSSIEILKSNRDPKSIKSSKWTPYEGVPTSSSGLC